MLRCSAEIWRGWEVEMLGMPAEQLSKCRNKCRKEDSMFGFQGSGYKDKGQKKEDERV